MLDLVDLIDYCLAKKGVEETCPFGPDALVYKVCGKMFALTSPDNLPVRINLKCDPDRAMELRDIYESVIPGYHMNKKHWNTVILNDSMNDELVRELIDHSYNLVVQGLSKRDRDHLDSL
ncbi:MAG: MmcQ/YjbR family DNA-binding protein [Akkermansiaceae bacterium]